MKCICGFATNLSPRSAAFHRVHRANHLEVYPMSTTETRRNLDTLVELHELHERERAA